MAVELTTGATGEITGRPVSARHFARLKLRLLANGLTGRGWRIALFVLGILAGLWFAGSAFLALAAPGLAGNREIAELVAGFGGALLVLGWVLLPLVFFGVDETLDPARFALLPVPRRTLLTGLLAAALIGIPAAATLVATAGLVVSAAALGGWSAGVVAALGVVAGLLVCVAASRAVTSAFATMLRSRRVRDLAAVLLAVFAALLGPLQIALLGAARRADWDQLAGVARLVGWTPLAAPYTIGLDLADGRAWAVPVKLVITVATLGALLWWWSRSLESAMVGTAAGIGTGGARAGTGAPPEAPVAQLFPRVVRWLPRDRYGALVAREVRYWWRDTRRRANLISIAVAGVFVPLIANLGSRGMVEGQADFDASPTLVSLSMIFVGSLAAITLVNQFGFDGSAYGANVIAGVPGRLELRARVFAFSLYIVPLLTVISIVLAFLLREPRWAGLMVGALFAAYGGGLAVALFVSIIGAYALPETSNPFAVNSGGGAAKSLLTFVAIAVGIAVSIPMVVAGALLPDVWLWLAAPVGIGYGLGAALLGSHLAGDLLDRRMPELLLKVTPRG
ncbi:ABC transporter permease [Plantactinospora sp. CA-290183]|uniref:ABC transporter permease n=1 Tax=Plantactinospora sp. CA-290183 TaxID=3240006 RepID=UPI003D91D9EE